MGLKTRLSDIFNRYGFTKQAFSLCYESVLLHDARLCFQAGCTGALLNVVLFLCATQFGILSSGKYVYLASCIVYAAVAFAVKHAALRNLVLIQYTLLAGIYIEGILASAAYSDSVSVIFPVMLAAAPQLLTERFWRMIVVTYACCLLHILVAFHTKAPTLAWFDTIHIAVFSVSGFCAHYFVSRLRIKTLLTGLQRDTLIRRLRLAHRDLKRRAEHDGLTGLLTRNALVRRLKPVLAGERAFLLGIMDIDDFKGINDTFGHSAGDVVLRRMGAVLQEQLGDADMASRIGGDEFVFVIRGTVGKEFAESLLPRICAAFVTYEDVPCPISVSIGFAAFPNDGAEFEVLYKEADKALYHAKREGKRQCAFYGELPEPCPAP